MLGWRTAQAGAGKQAQQHLWAAVHAAAAPDLLDPSLLLTCWTPLHAAAADLRDPQAAQPRLLPRERDLHTQQQHSQDNVKVGRTAAQE